LFRMYSPSLSFPSLVNHYEPIYTISNTKKSNIARNTASKPRLFTTLNRSRADMSSDEMIRSRISLDLARNPDENYTLKVIHHVQAYCGQRIPTLNAKLGMWD
jgi:hypothetical protein